MPLYQEAGSPWGCETCPPHCANSVLRLPCHMAAEMAEVLPGAASAHHGDWGEAACLRSHSRRPETHFDWILWGSIVNGKPNIVARIGNAPVGLGKIWCFTLRRRNRMAFPLNHIDSGTETGLLWNGWRGHPEVLVQVELQPCHC